ncbi:MAG TPA: hypothetical protein VFV07_02425 [Rhizomicrobium sp.]|nr:hypothetical protein [Rhizomicrobium sp.]
MRLHFYTAVPAAVALVGLVSALSAPASASEPDPASGIRGSLGVSLDDLVFSHGAGATVFLLNGGFALLFAAVCIAVRSKDSKSRGTRIPLRTASKFAR